MHSSPDAVNLAFTDSFGNAIRYNGEVNDDNVPHGNGTADYYDAIPAGFYNGEWQNGLNEGYGEMEWSNGNWYKGGWLAGQWHGNDSKKIGGQIFNLTYVE